MDLSVNVKINNMKYIVIGCGISGLAIANMLQDNDNEVIVFEKDSRPGGLIKCDIIKGNLFHLTGGHVFNTKRQDVLDWFWKHFNKKKEYTKAFRNSSIIMQDGNLVPYPIEDHVYCLDKNIQKSFIKDLITITKEERQYPNNFDEFLRGRFGKTLYNIYFQPYNYKIWRRDLTEVPLNWLEGKLPMPTVEEMIFNNINHIEEHTFVHSSFYYARRGGSQFIADRLSKDLNIIYNSDINKIEKEGNKWKINDITCDRIIFCGNIKQIPNILISSQIDIKPFINDIKALEAHGTTSVFCEIDKNPYSWLYMPSKKYESHRIICTGNLSKNNNAKGKMTASIEFTDYINKEDILMNLKKMPYSPKYITHHYEKYTYPIQNIMTRNMINNLKMVLEPYGIYILGRFAEWEYYNMDTAIGAAIDLGTRL